jgi:uncharacterized protein YjbJ (UPF0337 family)
MGPIPGPGNHAPLNVKFAGVGNRTGRLLFQAQIHLQKGLTMDENTIKGAAKDFSGNVKGTVGDLTGDSQMQAEGTVDQVVGTAQRAYGRVKDTVTKQTSGLGTAVADQLDETSAYLGDAVAERPLTALLIAGAIGFVLASLIKR